MKDISEHPEFHRLMKILEKYPMEQIKAYFDKLERENPSVKTFTLEPAEPSGYFMVHSESGAEYEEWMDDYDIDHFNSDNWPDFIAGYFDNVNEVRFTGFMRFGQKCERQ